MCNLAESVDDYGFGYFYTPIWGRSQAIRQRTKKTYKTQIECKTYYFVLDKKYQNNSICFKTMF